MQEQICLPHGAASIPCTDQSLRHPQGSWDRVSISTVKRSPETYRRGINASDDGVGSAVVRPSIMLEQSSKL